jgi:precorrin-6Y C5,15-methyltransferase (decarboxylating)
MTPIHVIGIGLDGAAGLSPALLTMIDQAAILAGSDRHLSYFPEHPGRRWPLLGLEARLQEHMQQPTPSPVVVLTSGDPLFFGLGRRLLQVLPAEHLTFHPHISSVQLAFNRIKRPWQEATLISAHGRSLARLEQALKQHKTPIAVLTDPVNTPAAIARYLVSLALPVTYQLWLCENLGSSEERIQRLSIEAAQQVTAAALNVVILEQMENAPPLADLPVFGLPDAAFCCFRDRPGLITKREIRVQILAELALQAHHVIWDVGAGTGSVSIEIARLVPQTQIWAIEQTPAGYDLIRQNVARFAVDNVTPVHGPAPEALTTLPPPHRVFIGGSGGHLSSILDVCATRLQPTGRILVALTTLENLATVTQWLQGQDDWQGHYQQIALTKSVAIGPRHRWSPLNPVTLVSLARRSSNPQSP